ncbi:MAG TPA: protein kinase, partial [Ktedonobacterales bacterium]|nr:protein kinase [Ktedonobacterales bacterium]
EEKSRLYLVMDYVQGKDLEERLNDSLTKEHRPLDEAQVLRWAIDISGALDEMHNLGVPVIHRDIKPANIKITPDGRPILIDFGLAKLQAKGPIPTMTAAQGVSPGFAPPEQYMARGRTDPRTDIYALGATLYACLTGKDPPEAPGRLLAQTGAGGTNGMQLVPPRRINPKVSDASERIVLRALELSPNNRQQSARELQDELIAALQRLTGAVGGTTMGMGPTCTRCGTQNRPDAARCVNCGTSLRETEGPPRSLPPGGPLSDVSAKRPALSPAGGGRAKEPGAGVNRTLAAAAGAGGAGAAAVAGTGRTGRQVAVAAPRTGKQPAVAAEPRSARQAAVAAEPRSGKQPIPNSVNGTGKQKALVARVESAGVASAGAVAAKNMATALLPAQGAIAPIPAKGAAELAAAPARGKKAAVRATATVGGARPAWIGRRWDTPVLGFGKVMLTLAAIEVVWGAIILALGGVALATQGSSFPVAPLVLGWLVVVFILSILGAQALGRPVYRKNELSRARRWLQGIAITLYSLAVQAAGIWGATVFMAAPPNPVLAIASYALFGISALIAGIVGIATVLG